MRLTTVLCYLATPELLQAIPPTPYNQPSGGRNVRWWSRPNHVTLLVGAASGRLITADKPVCKHLFISCTSPIVYLRVSPTIRTESDILGECCPAMWAG